MEAVGTFIPAWCRVYRWFLRRNLSNHHHFSTKAIYDDHMCVYVLRIAWIKHTARTLPVWFGAGRSYPYTSGLLHWQDCLVLWQQPWGRLINQSHDNNTHRTKQSTTKPCSYFYGIHYQHIEAATKWPPFSRRHFQMSFLVWKCMNFNDIQLTKFQHWFG